jgi:hypothetical protein
MIINVHGMVGVGTQVIDYNYKGDTTNIKEDEIINGIDEIKSLTLKKFTGKEDLKNLMSKVKLRNSTGSDNLLPTDYHSRTDPQKNIILREVLEILNDRESILSIVYQPLAPEHFAQGSVSEVGVGPKDSYGSASAGIHKKAKKKKTRKKKRKSKRKSRRKRKTKRKIK